MGSSDFKLAASEVRWRCESSWLDFDTTAEVEPVEGVVGQDDAVDALRFGLEVGGAGQNIFIRGLTGTGRMSLVSQLLADVRPPCDPAPDRCFVHNFEQPDHPRLLTIPRGRGRDLQTQMEEFIEFISEQLGEVMAADAVRAKRTNLDERLQRELRELTKPFEDELRENDLAMITVQLGPTTQPAIVPLIDGKPTAYPELEQLRASGKLSDHDLDLLQEKIADYARRFEDVNHEVQRAQADYRQQMRELNQTEARAVLVQQSANLRESFEEPEIAEFVDAVIDDMVKHRLGVLAEAEQFVRQYRVNLVASSRQDSSCPIVVENSPTLTNLLGSIEREFLAGGVLRSDHMMIQGGSLLRADGGYLILEAREVMNEPGAWRVLMRALRTRVLEIMPSEMTMFSSGPMLKPEPIDLNIKVILVGEPGIHLALDAYDPDFPNLFKVLVDFETSIDRDAVGAKFYAGILAQLAAKEDLPPFSADAVAVLVEQGARIAGRSGRLTTRFGRIADIAREAAFLAGRSGDDRVTADHAADAIRRGRFRANLPARQFRKQVTDGTIRVQTDSHVIGQVNGLAVVQSGPLTYGFPTRITATIGPGTAGAVNIEREAELSGAIHTKGFYILGGLLRHLLRSGHPPAYSASIAFEQSYGGIDGDSASGAEMCCLVSALTEVPIDQSLAMTGAIDQHGHILPIGAVTEKVEGFFAVCRDRGFTGRQGVIVPQINAGDLMVNPEVVSACENGDFRVYAVDTIYAALAVLTGQQVVARDPIKGYPEGTLLHLAERRALEYWKLAARTTPTD